MLRWYSNSTTCITIIFPIIQKRKFIMVNKRLEGEGGLSMLRLSDDDDETKHLLLAQQPYNPNLPYLPYHYYDLNRQRGNALQTKTLTRVCVPREDEAGTKPITFQCYTRMT
jgi:hypothetical protein